MKIRWTEKAFSDALGIHDYISAQSAAYADAVFERILTRALQLADFPLSGSIVSELGRTDVREVLVHSFRLLYRVTPEDVRILAVVHGSRHLKSDMLGET